MALDWTKCTAVESVPGKVSGAWAFGFPEQVTAVLDFAARSLEAPIRR
jgi:hypothetical protein